ncbi:MAG: ribose-phosphate diphosphokinase [Candidatus Jacksonbacteria bacterium]|nr:ribose-phosphate diphosphokinase [Candidatus Jacksonbacteria bacterium]
MPLLFSGTSHPSLAKSIAKRYKIALGKCEIKKFSCGETYVKLDERVRGEECFILQTTSSRVNDCFMELYLLADALCRHDASLVTAIIPHFSYARQDRRAAMGEPISAQLVSKLLVASGVTNVISFDLHSDQIEGFFSVPVDNLHCYHLFAEYFLKKRLSDPVIVVPDTGAAKLADRLTRLLKAPIAIFHKTRPRHQKAEHTHLVGDVKGKTVILFDDMIDTGGSICAAKDEVIARGALPEVYAAATHAVFSGPAYERLAAAHFKEIVVTDTIPLAERLPNLKVLSVVELLEKVL